MKITLFSMYNYDNSLFDQMVLPETVDRELTVDAILLECGELGILYPDFEFLSMVIGVWSKKEIVTWEKLQKTVEIEYNPIDNYNRIEDYTKDVVGNATSSETSFDSKDLEITAGGDNTGKETFHSVIRGNVGVTTTQKMLEEEREIAKFNIYDYIANSFKNRFSLEVY